MLCTRIASRLVQAGPHGVGTWQGDHELRRSADRAVGVGGRALRRQQDFKDLAHLTVQEAKAHPEVFAGKSIGQVADHFETIIRGLGRKPAVVGHSFDGLLAQILAGASLKPWTEAKVDTDNPEWGPLLDHLGREGQYRATGGRQRLLQMQLSTLILIRSRSRFRHNPIAHTLHTQPWDHRRDEVDRPNTRSADDCAARQTGESGTASNRLPRHLDCTPHADRSRARRSCRWSRSRVLVTRRNASSYAARASFGCSASSRR